MAHPPPDRPDLRGTGLSGSGWRVQAQSRCRNATASWSTPTPTPTPCGKVRHHDARARPHAEHGAPGRERDRPARSGERESRAPTRSPCARGLRRVAVRAVLVGRALALLFAERWHESARSTASMARTTARPQQPRRAGWRRARCCRRSTSTRGSGQRAGDDIPPFPPERAAAAGGRVGCWRAFCVLVARPGRARYVRGEFIIDGCLPKKKKKMPTVERTHGHKIKVLRPPTELSRHHARVYRSLRMASERESCSTHPNRVWPAPAPPPAWHARPPPHPSVLLVL